ncbi:cation/H(+) antiporter 15-like [Trifolium pratense]|uniref:cation/H(+) antiporter 15-like n=1 Tax=Trifolium pratense TaxID=57577 RepID=UPI001E691470|nr:cation/H(+) antiporter 15-like [Trifolium pratense]
MDDAQKHIMRSQVSGCYTTGVSNGNDIWQSDSVLPFFLPSFAAQVAFMLFANRFLYYFLRPFNQPPLVAEILTGFLLSPEILGTTKFFSDLVPLKMAITGDTISYVGLVYYVFLAGLDMNLETIISARKKAISIAVAGTIIPMVIGGAIYALFQSMLTASPEYLSHYNAPKAYLFWTLIFSVTGFPIVTQILADLKLLYTGLGRVALTAAMINDFINWIMFSLLIPFEHEEKVIYSLLSTTAFIFVCFVVIRPYLVELIVRKTKQNEWDNYQLFFVVMGAYVCATVTDLLGTHPVVGALVYGIMLPRGKFTNMLIEKTEDFGAVYLAPLFFATCGMRLQIFSVIKDQGLVLVVMVLFLSFIPKILSTVVATRFFGMPALDGVAIGLLMNTKGVLPLIMLNIAWDKQILSVESSSVMMVSVLLMTAAAPLIINAVYKPRKLYKLNKLRTVQNLKVEAELRVLACVHNPRHATGFINILEACNAIQMSSLRIFALQLVEITGTTISLLAAHINTQSCSEALTKSEEDLENITLTFNEYEERNENTRVETLAAVSTYSTIHQDIHTVAQEKQATIILLPFHKDSNIESVLVTTNKAFQNINQNVMRDAPCSVGIFVDRGLGSLFKVNLRILVLFIGGPDDREALALAWRMSKHASIQLSVVRLYLFGQAAEVDSSPQEESRGLLSTVLDCEKQRELDDEYVNTFRLKAMHSKDSTTYSDKAVHSREDITQVLNELDKVGFDLYILGQGKGRNSSVFSELMKWTDCPELGVIGDMVASNNFGSCSSLLVVQQYGFGGMVFENTTHSQNPGQGTKNDHDDDDSESGDVFVRVEQ